MNCHFGQHKHKKYWKQCGNGFLWQQVSVMQNLTSFYRSKPRYWSFLNLSLSMASSFSSTILRAFWKASSKLRPIAITSPEVKMYGWGFVLFCTNAVLDIADWVGDLMEILVSLFSINPLSSWGKNVSKMISLLLTDALHGAADLGGNPEELAEIPARHLHHTVIQTGLEVGCCWVSHRVPIENTFTDLSLPFFSSSKLIHTSILGGSLKRIQAQCSVLIRPDQIGFTVFMKFFAHLWSLKWQTYLSWGSGIPRPSLAAT